MLEPLPAAKWSREMAAHLLNRAGFGGPPAEIDRLHAKGLDAAVQTLVGEAANPGSVEAPAWARPDADRVSRMEEYRKADPETRRTLQREEQRLQRSRMEELRHRWLQRMASGANPLGEKLTLFWHGHFATSAQKVKDPYLMWRQIDLFRRLGCSHWPTLLMEASKDPAMLVWLDQAQSRKEHPNENFARELMELFALGEGNYTEQDITEAARALTGWTMDRGRQSFTERKGAHDTGQKTLFGQRGNYDGDDVVRLVVNHPNASKFITAKLWKFFVDEMPEPGLVADIAVEFERNGRQFQPLLETIFRSGRFYSAQVRRQQIKSPVQWLIGSVRMLERELPPPQACDQAMRGLGQELLLPPNVKGWDGGFAWITTNNLLNRHNFSHYLVLGQNPLAGGGKPPARGQRPKAAKRQNQTYPVELGAILPKSVRRDHASIVTALEDRFLQGPLKVSHRQSLLDYLATQGELDEEDLLHAIRLIMSTPEYQLC